MSGVRMMHLSNDWWKFFEMYQYYTMALRNAIKAGVIPTPYSLKYEKGGGAIWNDDWVQIGTWGLKSWCQAPMYIITRVNLILIYPSLPQGALSGFSDGLAGLIHGALINPNKAKSPPSHSSVLQTSHKVNSEFHFPTSYCLIRPPHTKFF